MAEIVSIFNSLKRDRRDKHIYASECHKMLKRLVQERLLEPLCIRADLSLAKLRGDAFQVG